MIKSHFDTVVLFTTFRNDKGFFFRPFNFRMDFLELSDFADFSCSCVEVPGRAVLQFTLEHIFMNLSAA